MVELLEKLCALNGGAGDEGEVRDFITEQLKNCDVRTDNSGNLLVHKKGRKTSAKKVMLAAHMDEVAFIVTHINKDGFLKFAAVGGIAPGAVFGRRVYFPKHNFYGVIGGNPVHSLKGDEKDCRPEIDDLYADIGVTCREEAAKLVSPGDLFYFSGSFYRFGENCLRGKAIDDRLGCAVMIDILRKDSEYDVYGAFTSSEEVGTRGAVTAAYNIKPDIAVILETTTACDIPSAGEEDKKICRLGGGTVISYMDTGTIYDRELYRSAFDIAAENGLKAQTKTRIAGGNDSAAIHKAAGGVRTVALSVPCRYLHTDSCVINAADFGEMHKLTEKILQNFQNR